MKNVPFTGSAVAIITPFDSTGKIDYTTFGQIVEDQIANCTDAIVVCGTTGEASAMPDKEHLEAIEFVINKVNKRVPVIAGTGSNDTAHGVALSKAAADLGADALLLVTPYYNKTSQAGLIKHFTMTVDAAGIPAILYNVPGRTGMTITVDTCKELSKHPNIVAIKEASGDIALAAKIKAACGDDLALYSGNDDMIVPMLSIGGKGVISVLANVCPKETHDMCQLYFDGKVKESAELQIKYMDLVGSLFCDVNPIPVKAAMNLMGYAAGDVRLPLENLSAANVERLKASMKNVGII